MSNRLFFLRPVPPCQAQSFSSESTSEKFHFAPGSTKGNKAEPALTGKIVLIVVLVFAVQAGLTYGPQDVEYFATMALRRSLYRTTAGSSLMRHSR